MFFECPAQESNFTFSVTNKKDKDLWEGPLNAGMRQLQATRPKSWKADDDDGELNKC
jgi:hypothetical protein